ncbi:MAG TPA: hypothetical protein VHK00_05625 [Miltoncostaeaceae bacterium]|nr:hypothetical protein [Miltoncostaeaceae bacterium]
MAAPRLTLSDLARDLGEVARGLPSWRRGEPDEAARETLEYAAGALHRKPPALWAWTGRTMGGEPAVALPVRVPQAIAFAPEPHARTLVGALGAAVDAGGAVEALRLEEWRGLACLAAPGMDAELFGLALSDAVGDGWRVAVAAVPEEVALGGPLLLLPPARGSGGRGLTGLAQELAVHPVRIILELLAREQPIAGPYPPELAHSLREWGCVGERSPAAEALPSLAIEDDPCPRRRHARTVLQRMLRMGKVGPGYHTEFDHFRRGAPAHEGRQALDVAEALLRAGLLGEKPSVGQRHIYLNVKALPEIHALIDRGETRDAVLERTWTAPAPGAAGASTAPPTAPSR